MKNKISSKLCVEPPVDHGEFKIYRGKEYIKLTSKGDTYEVIDASTRTFGKSTVGLVNGEIACYGTDMNETLMKLIHEDIIGLLSKLTMKDIRKAWESM